MHSRRRLRGKRLTLVLVGVLAVVTLGLVAFAFIPRPVPTTVPISQRLTPTPTKAPITFAAVGDSITAGNSPDFSAGRTGSLSWVTYVKQDAGLTFAGGWAEGGAKTERMAANVQPVKADVLAIIAGTNDFGNGVPFADTAAHLDQIVKTVGAPRVVVSSVPPRDRAPGTSDAFNAQLAQFVKSRGWTWVDAAAGLRDGDHYKVGLTLDGTHPTATAAKILGDAISTAIAQ